MDTRTPPTTKSNKPRWIDDNYPDSVQPMRRARDIMKAPSLVKRIIMFPFLSVIFIASFPAIATYLIMELVMTPKSLKHKVQEQASKTAYGVMLMRHFLYEAGLCDDYLTNIYISLPKRLLFKILALYRAYTGKILEIGVFKVA